MSMATRVQLLAQDGGRGAHLELGPARVADEEDVVAAAPPDLDLGEDATAGDDDLPVLAGDAVDDELALLDLRVVVDVSGRLDAGDRILDERPRRDARLGQLRRRRLGDTDD